MGLDHPGRVWWAARTPRGDTTIPPRRPELGDVRSVERGAYPAPGLSKGGSA